MTQIWFSRPVRKLRFYIYLFLIRFKCYFIRHASMDVPPICGPVTWIWQSQSTQAACCLCACVGRWCHQFGPGNTVKRFQWRTVQKLYPHAVDSESLPALPYSVIIIFISLKNHHLSVVCVDFGLVWWIKPLNRVFFFLVKSMSSHTPTHIHFHNSIWLYCCKVVHFTVNTPSRVSSLTGICFLFPSVSVLSSIFLLNSANK